MLRKTNHSRSIALGDIHKNSPISSSLDTFDRIYILEFGLKILETMSEALAFSSKFNNPRSKSKFLGKKVAKRVMENLYSMPKTLKLMRMTIEDAIFKLRRKVETEPLVPSQSLEKEENQQDN
jgi:hypothetical protein